ncbi:MULTISPECIES: DUF5674 family protein [unclassified Butyrivibrio]|uniref:DUF5674 family protein n=1 Tax=unclassified Butyrivibrio TaxID=2639466 RepID=UPI0003F9A6DD|nr:MULTISPECIES: DUF5674 family protein [unclassified Butyrivibrio]
MIIVEEEIKIEQMPVLEDKMYFNEDEMVKAVADVDKGILALNAELHSDLEQMLLENGSDQKSLYGFNIYFDGEIEYDSMINPPRNREAGFPRVGRDVADPVAREKIKELVEKWIKI